MTMPRGASRALFTGNGQAAEFPFFFKVFEEDQLSVLITSPSGVTSAATGWTAELDENGGTVRYLHDGAPLPEGWKLAIMRDMPFVQEVDLITGTRFDPEVIETALDVATAERQQLLERLDRAVVVEATDEGGPEALLADIRDARATALACASGASASANAAADSARSAAGSAAVATEQREAACVCAGEAKNARDVAIAQAEAANTLMEAELSKVNAIVAANRTDQQAAVSSAREWAEKAPGTPVDYDGDGNPRYSARHWAENAQKIAMEPPTAERRGAVRVGEGLHLTTGENGETDVLCVDDQFLNSEAWITESGGWTAPVRGWFEILLINGGQGAYLRTTANAEYARSGSSGARDCLLIYLEKGEEVPVVIGAGGQSMAENVSTTSGGALGGTTTFKGHAPRYHTAFAGRGAYRYASGGVEINTQGAGPGGREGRDGSTFTFYGAGGGAYFYRNSTGVITASSVTDGIQGAVRARWHDPAKAAGPEPQPALLSARRKTVALAGKPATVNLYDPETGQGSVWRAEDAPAKLVQGLVTQEQWEEACAARAAEAYAAWLADPDTETGRYDLLRAARDAKLSGTDYLVAPDYPLTEEQRPAVIAYRQALRDLPALEGAPWDGGGELTPWPALAAGEGPTACA